MEEPLILRACQAGQLGRILPYDGGVLYEAGFIYLDGEADATICQKLLTDYASRMFIPLSDDWKQTFEKDDGLASRTRYQMKPLYASAVAILPPVPYRLTPFDEKAFSLHPFHHCCNYAGFRDFAERGSGAVVWSGDEIVSSASSYISFENEVELDVSTLSDHRRKCLGLACAAAMLNDCFQRGITVHWDAQNLPSLRMAEKLGFVLDESYTAYYCKGLQVN